MGYIESQFPGKDVVYTLVAVDCVDEDEYEESLVYIGTDYSMSRTIPANGLEDHFQYRHRVYVDSELMFESSRNYNNVQWVSTYDLIDELEAEVEESKQKLAKVVSRLVELGQR